MPQNSKTNKPVLDKYKDTLQPMVDEALEVQTLAPAVQEAIIQNKPLNDALQQVAIDTVKKNPEMRNALVETIADGKAIKKSRVDYRQPGFWIPIVVSAIVGIASVIVAILALNHKP